MRGRVRGPVGCYAAASHFSRPQFSFLAKPIGMRICVREARKPAVFCSEDRDTVESNGGGQSLNLRHLFESTVRADGKDTDSSYFAVQRIQKLPVAADSDVEVSASAGVSSDDCAGDRRQRSTVADRESGNGRRSRI
jgi:hypothetical protein